MKSEALFGYLAAALAMVIFIPSAFSQKNVLSLAVQGNDVTNRRTSPDDILAGSKLFRSHCSTCHGRNAEGFRGPNLSDGRFRHGQSDGALFRNILQGISGTSMAGVYLGDSQVWQIVSYLRSLSGAGKTVSVPGDPQRGRIVYEQKGQCSTCHMVSGLGGRRGTDLTRIGWQRSVEHLRDSILRPSNDIGAKFRIVQLSMESGADIEGLLLNEDTYSIQLMDEEENLVSVSKAEIIEIVRPVLSLMPDYLDTFEDEEFADLIAYLHSLYGETTDE